MEFRISIQIIGKSPDIKGVARELLKNIKEFECKHERKPYVIAISSHIERIVHEFKLNREIRNEVWLEEKNERDV